MENEQGQSEQGVFFELLNQFVKVVYSDGSTLAIMKGILKKADSSFIYIKGDYSEKIIAISKINKIEKEKI